MALEIARRLVNNVWKTGPVEEDSGGSSPVLEESATLTDEQIKTLPTTAVQLVSAPDAGSYLSVIAVILQVDASNDSYANISASADLAIQATGGGGIQALFAGTGAVSSLLTSFSRQAVSIGPYSAAAVDVTTITPQAIDTFSIENKGLELKANNPALGNFTDGDALNAMKVKILYVVIEV